MADIFRTVITSTLVCNFVIVPCNLGFTKFHLNLPYLGFNTLLRALEIRHYGPVCDVSETCLYLLPGCDNIRIFKLCIERTRCEPSYFVQFENEIDVKPSGINMNRSCFLSS